MTAGLIRAYARHALTIAGGLLSFEAQRRSAAVDPQTGEPAGSNGPVIPLQGRRGAQQTEGRSQSRTIVLLGELPFKPGQDWFIRQLPDGEWGRIVDPGPSSELTTSSGTAFTVGMVEEGAASA